MTQNQPRDVRELQHSLRAIAFFDHKLPLIAVDGIYGPETAAAVEQLQREHRLPATGRVDLDTWELIRAEYLRAAELNGEPRGVSPFPNRDHVVGVGDTGELVAVIQLLLNRLCKRFTNLAGVEPNGIYGEETNRAIAALQEKAGLPPTGAVDLATWNALAAAYHNYR